MHVCTAFRPPVNSTKDTYVVMDFSACISTQFYNNISVNITMFNWQVGPRTLPPTSTDCGGNVCPAGQVLWMVLFLPYFVVTFVGQLLPPQILILNATCP